MAMKKLHWLGLVALSICLLSNQAPTQGTSYPINFVGTVADKREVAISKVHIWIHEIHGNTTYTAQTDQLGRFATQLPDGYYDVLFSTTGFSPYCKEIWIKSGEQVKLLVHLNPNEYNFAD
jgi:Carboxypeptidase regulatory-like domain